MIPDIDSAKVAKTYDRWAPVYDVVFGSIFAQARRTAVDAGNRRGGRILEVGVGTGISLAKYSPDCQICGIDLSEDMLEKARKRVEELRLTNVERLAVMDAENLRFPDRSFDVVAAQYVVNTVPHPEIALNEFRRVLKVGGEIILINRIGANAGPRRTFEKMFQPMARQLGWQSEFPWERFGRWLERSPDMHLIERTPVPPLGHFSLIRFGKVAAKT
jgi:phosphatidylethanolamine/phosphatidyl-N-methylethanolamine N-methyltransferase